MRRLEFEEVSWKVGFRVEELRSRLLGVGAHSSQDLNQLSLSEEKDPSWLFACEVLPVTVAPRLSVVEVSQLAS